jgi:hypothetical protein
MNWIFEKLSFIDERLRINEGQHQYHLMTQYWHRHPLGTAKLHIESTCDISASPLRCLMSFRSSFLVSPYCASKCPLIGVQNSKQVQVFSWQEQVDI